MLPVWYYIIGYIFLKEHGYSIKTAQKLTEAEKSHPVKQLLDEPEIITTINTKYRTNLNKVACLNDEEIWTRENENTMKLFNICEGSLLKSITTKSGNLPTVIAVTKDGHLIHADHKQKSVNIVKNEEIETLIRLKKWRPRNLCMTSSGDLLVVMHRDDYKQSKIVRYYGSTEKQTIQLNDDGKPNYSSEDPKYISENKNLDICVADYALKRFKVKENEKHSYGTLGGFVKDTRSSESCHEAYALTCNHLYPTTNTAAYATIDGDEREVGKCIFTTRENSCDFAVVEINKDIVDKYDFKFRRDDEKKCNAKVSEYFPINVGIVHKNGSETKWTRGRIVSSAFHDAVNNKEVFVVKGLDRRPFSTLGDSGSIVFARDNSVAQDTVDVLGMVYSNNPDIRDNTGHSEYEEEKAKEPSGHSEGNLKSGIDQSNCAGESKLKDADKSESDQSLASGTNPQIKSKSRKNPENYSFCFRMNNAIELLEKEKNLLVSFERVENSSADI
ncbi:uncharacterized protein LOC133193170 [Saccostrea echinata]|uniref:uncharacterized protein LOC133193170 n=1 Tax=Saccostrea echinata TaxID=191078 RepID=UPI002A831A82|nr:uncharacterized protein LOC133193170 [Saccostrea echinata]